ncbi:hypothetical protein PSV08DRAFT_226293 [Bipolaris maydis]|uniref:uncharacterized protein n=1 Tax=Cochliobolus heterostrophus TaxID=5016 RepID=UPI0024CFCB2C|nr:hypothetical protein PSV08DRAFT_226293 [Bipolaris maydis]KAJ6279672.1 hypothetical protein J3E71DRAFT_220898 [Bipolaris maydis]
MAVIWGLDLHEIQWGKFKSSNMWNSRYHGRRTRFIVYQLAMILTVVSESLGTAALSDYTTQQRYVAHLDPNATVHNNNFVGIASYNIFVGIFVATIFGAAFFFDLFWPERRESAAVKTAWRVCSVLACTFTLSCALAYTYVVAAKSAYVTGVSPAEARRLLDAYGGSPMLYRRNGRAVASVVLLWVGMVFTFWSTYLLWHSLAHIEAFGPMSTHARNEKVENRIGEKDEDVEVARPVQAHVSQDSAV